LRPEQREGIEYEFDVIGDLDLDNTLIVSKTRIPMLHGAVVLKPGPELAEKIRDWLAEGEETAGPMAYRAQALDPDVTREQLLRLHATVKAAGLFHAPVTDGEGRPTMLGDLIVARGQALATVKTERPTDVGLRGRTAARAKLVKDARKAAETGEPIDADVVEDGPVEQHQHARMHVLWGKAGVDKDDRETRLAVTSHLIGHDVTSSSELKYAEAELIIERLRSFDSAGGDALKQAVDRWLGEYHAARAAADDAAEAS
jgi:hypothetical protein